LSAQNRDEGLDDGVLPPGRLVPPPPSPRLAEAIRTLQPVRARTRFGAFAAVGVAGLIAPAVVLAHHKMRADLAALPLGWVITAAALWAVAFASSLAAALIPARGDVLVRPARASGVGTLALAALVTFALLATARAPGVSLRPEDAHMSLLTSCLHCGGFALEMAAPFLLLGLVALRRLTPVGGARVGLALGAAGGAMGGLVLHFICPLATTAHVTLGHVGGALAAALIGAALLAWFRR
jgi:hypothetical protein